MKKEWLKQHASRLDYVLIVLGILLAALGLFFVYSASKSDDSLRKVMVQSGAALLGVLCMAGLSFFDYRVLRSYANHIFIATALLLLFVLLFGSGKEETGANSWIRFGGIGLQPSEPAKVAFALFFSAKLAAAKDAGTLNRGKEVLRLTACYAVITGLVVLQNDTGTALVFTFMFAVMLFVAGLSYPYILSPLGALCLLLPLGWLLLAPYQKDRILVFLNPALDPTGAGYQVLQSKIAIGSGELLGRGYLNGPQNQLGLLPEKDTDFIFATVGEEFGFLGCALVTVLLFFFVLRIFHLSKTANDGMGSLLCVGLGAMFLFHIVENVCMCLGLLPVTGIPLPFLSYGGSSLVTCFLALGFVLSVAQTSKKLSFHPYD